jgi:hypothetical protein
MRFMAALHGKSTTKPEEIQALVPKEQAHIAQLTKEGVIEATYVAQKGAWVVLKAESLEQATEILKTFPLYPLLDSSVTPLFG